MNASLSWIKAYVPDLKADYQEFRDAMTLSGTKVEGYTQFDKDLDQIARDDGNGTRGQVRRGKDSGRDEGYRPEGKDFHPLADEKAAEPDLFTQHDENLIQKHCRKVRRGHDGCPLQDMLHQPAAKEKLVQEHLQDRQRGHDQDQRNHAGLFQIREEAPEAQPGYSVRRFRNRFRNEKERDA